MPLVDERVLRDTMQATLLAAGACLDTARGDANSLVNANPAGQDAQGIIQLSHDLGMEQAGHVQPAAQACVVHRHNATAMLGDGWGWGQPSILLAPDVAIELARAHGGGAMLLTASCFLGPGATHSRGAQDGKHADPRTYAGRAALPCVKGLDVTHKQRP